ncbi:glutathione hydrolase 1 proenzyme-like [Rhincodon typus]|uniref:glutathione hydrolase 1 proenzyme-like n=1 Tax=Rhincodon typus TaxID=259920 RepID=UPI0020308CC7|nr:glutathione hydrolase 1 proenzyme-like [Rhincodon typus]
MVEENPTEINVLSEDVSNAKPLQSEIKQDDNNRPARSDSERIKTRKKMYCIIAVLLFIVVIICIGAILHLFQRCSACVFHQNAGVASDGEPCSKIGSDVFCKKNSNQILSENDIIYFPKLANTLQMIADIGPNAFYDGPIADDIVKYVSQSGGQISHNDLKQYKANKETPINVTVDGYTLYVPGAPSGGPVLALILKILEGYNFSRESVSTREKKVLTYHRIIEAFKFAFAERSNLEYPTSSDHTKTNISDNVFSL